MINQIPDVYQDNYLQTYDLYLWIAMVIVGIVGSLLFYKRMKRSTIDIQKYLLGGVGFFLFLFSIMRISFILSIKVENGAFYDEFTIIGYILGLGGLGGFLYGVERGIIKQTHFLMTISSIVGIVFGIIFLVFDFERGFIMDFTYVVSMADSILMLTLYLWLIKSSTGVIRNRIFIGLLGVLMIFLGMAFDSELVYTVLPTLPPFVAPVCSILGISLITYIQRY